MEKSENRPLDDALKEVSYKFGKEYKLHHRTLVNNLFLSGKSLYAYPLRLIWRKYNRSELDNLFCEHTPVNIGPVQIMITVPKKRQRKAVNRVLLRRRIREAFRLNHSEIENIVAQLNGHGTISLGFIYISNEKEDYSKIETQMCKLLKTVIDKIAKESADNND